jgi:tol-pal system protein YbgF
MINHRTLKQTRFACTLLALALAATPGFAVNKDMVQLQTQVHDLQDAVAHMQQSNDERMGVLKDLVQQTADSVNKMSVAVQTLEQKLSAQQDTANGKVDQVSGQVQSLNDSLDEVKARLNTMEKALQSVQSQQQSIDAALQNMAAANPANAAPGTAANPDAGAPGMAPAGSSLPPMQPATAPDNGGKPSAGVPFSPTQGPYANDTPPPAALPTGAGAPPVSDLYGTALRDYMAAKYSLATTEFGQVVQSYPDDSLAGNAYYYMGEIDYRAGKFAAAIKNYDRVVDQYPANQKVAVAHLHKGSALLALKQRDAGIAELRALIQRFPNSPEASQARTKLNGMGVPSVAKRPS